MKHLTWREEVERYKETFLAGPGEISGATSAIIELLLKQQERREGDPLYNRDREMLLRGYRAVNRSGGWDGVVYDEMPPHSLFGDILDARSYWNWKPHGLYNDNYGPSAISQLWGDYVWAGWEKPKPQKPAWGSYDNPITDLMTYIDDRQMFATDIVKKNELPCPHCGRPGPRPEPEGPTYGCAEYGTSEETKKTIHSQIDRARTLLQRREERSELGNAEAPSRRPVAPDHDREQGGEKTDPVT